MNPYKKAFPRSLLLIAAVIAAPSWAHMSGSVAVQSPPPKKLIEFGWDRPSPAFVASHIASMELRPFDGVVIQFSTGPRVFRRTTVDTTTLARDALLLQGVSFSKFTDNFALINLTRDSTWDWFSDADWAATLRNISWYARAAKVGGLRGIVLDYEAYGPSPWAYPTTQGQSFEQYATLVQARGRQFMWVLQSAFPNVTVLTLFQLSFLDSLAVLPDERERSAGLERDPYSLLPAFVAGMLEAVQGRSRLVDGNERAYYYPDSIAFQIGARYIREGALSLVDPKLRAIYRDRVRVGHGIFLDYLLGIFKWAHDTVAKRVPPENRVRWVEHNAYYALKSSDEYVWLYSQKVNWWSDDTLPSGISEALDNARRLVANSAPLPFKSQDLFIKAQ